MTTGFRFAGIVALAGVCLFPIAADAALTRTGTPNVQFTATGPAGLKIVGTTHELEVKDDATTLTISVPLANLDTGVSLRNKHMREKYLEVEKFPRAELSVARGEVQVPGPSAQTSGELNGTMVIHGVTHPARFSYRAKRDQSGIHVTGTTHVNIKEYGISVPSYLGVTVKPDVDIELTFDVSE